jgi:PRTRC genetic system protein A
VKEPEKPKLDPKAVAMGIRAQVDYKVLPVSGYDKPITYLCAKNGLFEARHSDLATVITKPKEILGIVEELKEGVTLNLPKVPFLFLQQTVGFFRGVEAKMNHSSEALVQIWWDREAKAHQMHVPEQTVSGGGVRHQSTFDLDSSGKYFHVMDIHSHGNGMSAFWSGTDNADEARVTTDRLFGVIGKIQDPIPMWKWRMRTRDGFIDLSVADIFELPQEKFNFTVKSEDIFRMLGTDGVKEGRVQLWCPVDPFKSVDVPAEWYEQVKGYQQQNHQQHGWGSVTRFPKQVKGFIYINGLEYEADGEGAIKATGHKLMSRDEFLRIQAQK